MTNNDNFRPRRKSKPTQTAIGSRERIEVYRRRIEEGRHLYHADDNPQADHTTRLINGDLG